VRELRGVMVAEGAQRRMLVASGGFTGEARAFAAATGVEPIEGNTLWPMIRAVQNAPASMSAAPPAPAASMSAAMPACPRCGSAMVHRVARQGANAGKPFFGCSQYPACKATLAVAQTPQP
jgi:restriction system protein